MKRFDVHCEETVFLYNVLSVRVKAPSRAESLHK
jgi:hypothetical protein